MSTRFPARYEKVAVLGSGGGGQVWAVRDRLTNETVALKALAEGATEREVQALVREAVMLSGLEGLGVPRVLRFGRLPGSQRPFMVRELVQGQSLLAILEGSERRVAQCLDVIAQTADQLTGLHRAGLLHGDIKPANIIVSAGNRATLVDLGLAAPWREEGIRPEGLTPRYAAPELFAGLRLTVRAEVFALGASLQDVLDACENQLDSTARKALRLVCARATHEDPAQRYPSADEFGAAIRHAARIAQPPAQLAVDASWPVVGVDAAANRLLTLLAGLAPGGVVAVEGKPGSGRTVLVRRIAWTLGMEGRDVAWVDERGLLPPAEALELELSACSLGPSTVVLVDGAENLPTEVFEQLARARNAGCKLVVVASASAVAASGVTPEVFIMPALAEDAAANLVRRAIPSLPDSLVAHVIARADGRPGKLRNIVRKLGTQAVVSPQDVDRLVEESTVATSLPPPSSLLTLEALLDQGKFEEAAAQLPLVPDESSVALDLCRARLALGRGEARQAWEILLGCKGKAVAGGGLRYRQWLLQAARAHIRLGNYQDAVEYSQQVVQGGEDGDAESAAVSLEAMACLGVAWSYGGKHDQAESLLRDAASKAEVHGNKRVAAVVLGSLAVALQRADKLTDARHAYERTLEAAEQAGDAGAVANTRLNLAVLAHGEGDLADAAKHLEAAIDMGRRAGRGSTSRQALLNLANLDIYLGRYVRARSSLDALNDQREHLSPTHRAQLIGLEAELAARTGEPSRAAELYETCAFAWQALDRRVDSAEARLEAVLISAWSGIGDPTVLARTVEQVAEALGDSTAHRTQLLLARGAVAAAQNDEQRARDAYDAALAAARAAGQKEWIWRTLEARSRLRQSMGQDLAARRDSEEALAVLEEIAARLPRDLREVYWDDPRRRAVRMAHLGTMASARARSLPMDSARAAFANLTAVSPRAFPTGVSSTVAALPAEERLTRLLEINRELAREHNLERLLERVTDHAISLVNAERGFVILAKDGDLVVHTLRSRGGDDVHARFSRSIAEKVIAGGEPVVTLSARDDDRMADYVSVHQLNVQSVACVPIRAPDNRTAGALYVETRLRPGVLFHAELPTLAAFADQAAVAIENAHLLAENKARADELAEANAELLKARNRLKELLGHRTAQLESTRRDLDATRAVLRGHFGYHGLVGTSERMRRVYALIDRVKDMDVPVLITGESGTGKEVVARAIHSSGPRAKKPFTGVNCGAIPEHLLESELFGHVRGAFTGADRDRKGLFRESEGGTILLDEIGEMPHKMQAGLLRVLQEHLVRPVGGLREEPVDCRVIAATNRDLDRMVADGSFREDLYYRLHVVEVRLPPLRERTDDIPMLIDHFLQIFATRYRRERKTISREALRFLCSCPWPGNVRQLENTLLNAWVMSDRPELELEDFEIAGLRPDRDHRVVSTTRGVEEPPSSAAQANASRRGVETSLSAHQATEKERILAALSACNWNRVKAAEVVGIPRRTFYRRLAKYGIQ